MTDQVTNTKVDEKQFTILYRMVADTVLYKEDLDRLLEVYKKIILSESQL